MGLLPPLCFYNIGNLKKALEAYNSALDIDPGRVGSLLGIRDIYTKLGDKLNAYKICIKLAKGWSDKGHYVFSNFKYEEALELAPDDAYSLARIGDNYKALGDLDNAMKYFSKVLTLNSQDNRTKESLIEVYKLIGDNHYNIDKYEDAKIYYTKALNLNPDNIEICNRYADCLFYQKDYNGALNRYSEVLKLMPDNQYSLRGISSCYSQQNDLNAAISTLNKALSYESDNAKTNRMLGDLYSRAGDSRRAEIAFQEAGENYIAQKNYNEAIECLNLALKINPKNYKTIMTLGDTYLNAGDNKSAVKCYNNILIDYPNYASSRTNLSVAYANLGIISFDKGDLVNALVNFIESMKMNRFNPEHRIGAGNCYLLGKKYDDAIQAFNEAINLAPDRYNIRVGLGQAYMGKHDYQKAISEFSYVLLAEPKNELVKNLLQECNAQIQSGRIFGNVFNNVFGYWNNKPPNSKETKLNNPQKKQFSKDM